jgi:hypothetical protein
MEKSIEKIWKDGFLKGEALVAPQVNDIYNRKSIHITDKFTRMFRKNMWAITAGATLLLIISFFIGALIAGVVLFITLIAVAYSAKSDMDGLAKLDKGQSSYDYLSAFQSWIEDSIVKYGSLYRFVYPIMILSFYFGLWFSDSFIEVRQRVAENSDNHIFGMHMHTTIIMLSLALVMGLFAKRIHREDVMLIYGGILKKLNGAIAEMDELREQR